MKKVEKLSLWKLDLLPFQEILVKESFSSSKIANRFRYLFSFFMLASGYFSVAAIQDEQKFYFSLYTYAAGLLVYFSITLIHSIVLWKEDYKLNYSFGFFNILSDYLIIIFMLSAWLQQESPNNFNFYLKNPSLGYFILPFLFSLIQLRISYIVF